jgi:metal-responsive CopG/Arc/MetJ family transcriptional regulator
MTEGRKTKISITLAADLLAAVDQDAELLSETRSSVIDAWLRKAAYLRRKEDLEAATEAYYRTLSPAEREDSTAIGRGASRAARRLKFDR